MRISTEERVISELPGRKGQIQTGDGITLHYLEAGSGQPLLIIPGWSQTAKQFKHQITGLSDRYRVIALDMRGHGQSEKPEYGYRISRLAKDVHEVIEAMDLKEVAILGHSMGYSVIWYYWDLFGSEHLSKILLIDQMPVVTQNPAWSEAEAKDYGTPFTTESLYETVNVLAGPRGVETTQGFIGNMVTAAMSQEVRDWVIACNLQFPRRHAASLLLDHASIDWRDTIPRIRLPTLIVGGRASLIPWTACAWMQAQIPGSRLEIFEEEEGGQHFMLIENPSKFNAIVADFLDNLSHALARLDGFRAALGNQDRRHLGVAGGHVRKHRSIGHTHALEPARTQFRIDHTHVISAHAAGSAEMVESRAVAANEIADLFVALGFGRGRDLLVEYLCQE